VPSLARRLRTASRERSPRSSSTWRRRNSGMRLGSCPNQPSTPPAAPPVRARLHRARDAQGGHGFSFALFNLAWAPAGAVGAIAGGALADHLGNGTSYSLLAALCAATLISSHNGKRRSQAETEHTSVVHARVGHRLAVVECVDQGQLVGSGLDEVSQPEQQPRAQSGEQRPGAVQGTTGGGDCGTHVGSIAQSDFGEEPPRRRV
jgi:hypothetical protein